MAYPVAVGWWYVTHPFVDSWRKLGRPFFYTILTITAFASMFAIYQVREPLLAVEYGTNRWFWILTALFYGTSVYVEIRCRKHLKANILVGAPELDPSGHGGKLITEGIYGIIRHPRYVAVWLGTVAVAFFTNYLAMYVMVVLLIPALYLVVVMEEKELRQRFGDDYDRYREQVPHRFIPRFL
jgi:protein-S-isoprenylcysteine O-methyltransferase Ste14